MRNFFRWRLRSVFFLVTVIGIVFGIESNRVRQRRYLLSQLTNDAQGTYPDMVGTIVELDEEPSWFTQLSGDVRVSRIYAVNRSFREGESEMMKSIFPEAELIINYSNMALISPLDKRRLGIEE